MYLLGIDVGTSSVKVSIIEAYTQEIISSAQYPETEAEIIALKPGWAEQSPESWWDFTQKAILKNHQTKKYNPQDIIGIGIAYQMHGLVVVDKNQQVLRNAIIWCDSRAVDIGEKAFQNIGEAESLSHHLNSPGNFTASKLAWVKENEPEIFANIYKLMLPGDFIAMKLTGQITTSISALSEGIFWDFKNNQLSEKICKEFGFDISLFPELKPVFANHGEVKTDVANTLQLKAGIQVAYKAGDQPNNALSLNVLEPEEVAATAGTSGVIYGVSNQLVYDQQSRINTFAHVNYLENQIRTGVLLCINGTGILNSWARKLFAKDLSYSEMNQLASKIEIGSKGLRILPFGNGAERMLNNKLIGAHIFNIDLNQHHAAHILNAVQEGVAFSFRYGLDIMRENGLNPKVIRAGKSNLFLSEVFRKAFTGATQVPIELYQNDGSVGAALGAGIGIKHFKTAQEAFQNQKVLATIAPQDTEVYDAAYQEWKQLLNQKINNL